MGGGVKAFADKSGQKITGGLVHFLLRNSEIFLAFNFLFKFSSDFLRAHPQDISALKGIRRCVNRSEMYKNKNFKVFPNSLVRS